MRALRIATLPIAIFTLVGGLASTTIAAPTDTDHDISPVAGTLAVHQLPGGTFAVDDRVFQYRDYAMAGSTHYLSDSRLDGDLSSAWNWDVQASGDRPIPAWGTISIDGEDGTWSGQFSGIRQRDFEPVDVRAVLFGDGAYDGLCATLDISAPDLARSDTWVLDGIVHPVDMG